MPVRWKLPCASVAPPVTTSPPGRRRTTLADASGTAGPCATPRTLTCSLCPFAENGTTASQRPIHTELTTRLLPIFRIAALRPPPPARRAGRHSPTLGIQDARRPLDVENGDSVAGGVRRRSRRGPCRRRRRRRLPAPRSRARDRRPSACRRRGRG